MSKSSKLLRRMTITAVFIAIAVVIKCYTKVALTIPGLGIQVGLGGIFTFFPTALFGPIYGGVASAMCDFLGAIIAPTGPFNPCYTIVAFIGGFVKGLLWRLLSKKAVSRNVSAIILAILIVIGSIGAAFTISLNADGVMKGVFASQSKLPTKDAVTQMVEDGELSSLSKSAVSLAKYNNNTEKNPDNYRKYLSTYINLLTLGLELFALVGIALYGTALIISHKRKKSGKSGESGSFIRVLITVVLSGVLVTTLNTFLLRIFVSNYAGRSLLILWVPRVCEEIAVCAVQAIIITLLYDVLMRSPIKKQIDKL